MAHMTDRLERHECGGTILVGGTGQQQHIYCDRCAAFRYVDADDDDEALPSGTNREANHAAWDAGEDESPDAEDQP